MADTHQGKNGDGGLRKALERLARTGSEDDGPDPEAVLSETLQIISDCIGGVSLRSLITDMDPELRSLFDNYHGDAITELARLLGRVDFEEFVGQAAGEMIRGSGVNLDSNALALLDISINWDSMDGPTLSFGGLIDASERSSAWDSPLCSEPWISWATENEMTQDDLEFALGLKRGSTGLMPGDQVVIVGKEKKYPVFRAFDIYFVKTGDVGKVLRVEGNEVIVEFPKKGEGSFSPSELDITNSKVFRVRDFNEGEWVILNPRLVEEAPLGKYAWPDDLLEERGQVIRVDRKDSTLLIKFTKKRKKGSSDSEWISWRFAVPTEKPESTEVTEKESTGN